jgi:hypothetical protein
MNEIAKQKVREHLATDYGKAMQKHYGLRYVKKEIFHAIKCYTLGDKRPFKYFCTN